MRPTVMRLSSILTVPVLAALTLPQSVDAQPPGAPAAARVTHYDLQAEVRPAARHLRVRAALTVAAPAEDLAALRVFLHRELVVERAALDSHPVAFVVRDRASDAPGFSPTAVAIDFDLSPPLRAGHIARLELSYSGPISSTVSGVNLISERLTELALYSAWYPLTSGAGDFTYDLSVAVPADQSCISDGDLVERRTEGETVVCRFRRDRPGMDVPVIASNALKTRRIEATGFQTEVHYADLSDAAAEDVARTAIEGYLHMAERLGAPSAAGRLAVVISPRDGWGYSRVPLSVIPQAYAIEALGKRDGRFEVMHGNLHEIGHFWWQMADSATSDDWINESLAEFTALDACERIFGAESVETVRKGYEADVRQLESARPIVQTLRGDPTGYVLFYEKGSLIWEMLRQALGEEQLFGVLRRLHETYQGTRELTTQALVERFSKETAGRTDAFFTEWLRGSALPTVAVEWTARGVSASGRVILDGASLARHPLEMTFTRTGDSRAETRRLLISVGETRFSFTLPFTPDALAVDNRHLLLTRDVKISRVAE